MLDPKLKTQFQLNESCYLKSHSVGRPLKSLQSTLQDTFFSAWEKDEPWTGWIKILEHFSLGLGKLYNTDKANFCPQVNVSSALTKLVMSLERLDEPGSVVLMSEIDFPSMGYVLQKALPSHCQLRFIPKELDVSDLSTWEEYLLSDVSLVHISHAYSNTGQLSPLNSILKIASKNQTLTVVDSAQSAGIIPLDLSIDRPDFLIGSSVKWSCGGPGAAYIWVSPESIKECLPKDVGWFSHEDPFLFNIHEFNYHKSSLRLLGGTPSVIPFAIAGQSLDFITNIGIEKIYRHNQALIDPIAAAFEGEFVSPRENEKRSGTCVLNFLDQQDKMLDRLKISNIVVDVRERGIRISPHIYNDIEDVEKLINVIKCLD